jgi:hypothetical protein
LQIFDPPCLKPIEDPSGVPGIPPPILKTYPPNELSTEKYRGEILDVWIRRLTSTVSHELRAAYQYRRDVVPPQLTRHPLSAQLNRLRKLPAHLSRLDRIIEGAEPVALLRPKCESEEKRCRRSHIEELLAKAKRAHQSTNEHYRAQHLSTAAHVGTFEKLASDLETPLIVRRQPSRLYFTQYPGRNKIVSVQCILIDLTTHLRVEHQCRPSFDTPCHGFPERLI